MYFRKFWLRLIKKTFKKKLTKIKIFKAFLRKFYSIDIYCNYLLIVCITKIIYLKTYCLMKNGHS